MLKKSFVIVFIQVFGSLLGIFTVYFVAGSMEPEVYSLVGIYTIVLNISTTFSDLGLETTMMREALLWIENDDNEKVVEYSTQAIVSRIMGFCMMFPFLLVYVLFMNISKYNGERTTLLFLTLIGACISSLNNAMSLIIRSRGDYVFAQAASTINNYVLKFSGLGLYFSFGANVYLNFYVLSSIPLFFIYSIKLRGIFDHKKIKLKEIIKKIYKARFLWLKTDLDYLKNNADSLLVSAIFPTSVMGAYTIFKNLEQLSKNIIEGFFDVLSQSTVRYKGEPEKLYQQEKLIKKIRNCFIILILSGIVIFSIKPDFFVSLIHLSKYEAIKEMVFCILIISIIHLMGKYEINALAFFASSKLNFAMGIMVLIGSIASFGIVYLIPNIEGVLSQRIIVYAETTLIAIILFRHQKEELYTEIKQ